MAGGLIPRESVSGALSGGTGKGINLNAWGGQKVSQDYSLLHSIFTYDIPKASFKELFNGSELIGAFTNATSLDGKLNLEAGSTLRQETTSYLQCIARMAEQLM